MATLRKPVCILIIVFQSIFFVAINWQQSVLAMSQAHPTRDVQLPLDYPQELMIEKHKNFLVTYAQNTDGYEQIMVDYLRMSGIYWSLTAMDVMGSKDLLGPREEMLEFIKKCQDPESGGIRASIGHDPHILYTLSAVQILAIHDALDENIVDKNKVVEYVKSLQQEDGSFYGDMWGEVDIRFSMCAVSTLCILDRLDAINTEAAVDFIMSCNNEIDGGFGSRPGSESHSGLIYCALGSLSILGRLDLVDADLLGWWLAERQLPSGGLNGRPEKLPDLCYSWWVISSLHILGRVDWIDGSKLMKFILASQDAESGGFSDRPGNMVDPFHTCFGLTGLSLLLHSVLRSEEGGNSGDLLSCQLKEVNPVLCMPQEVIDRLHIKLQTLST